MASRFLFNETLWEELRDRVPEAKMVRAAVAYLGAGGSKLLPLRKGDKLLVDMSLQAVRSGTTDPREVQKFLKKGVVVYTRQSLHAKFFVIDRMVIAGSSNISNNAKKGLDEAAVLTGDVAAVRAAITAFEQMCTEPVRKEYLERCLQEYKPPKFPKGKGGERIQRKLWVIGDLAYGDLPADEEEAANGAVQKVSKKLESGHYYEQCEVDFYHSTRKEKLFERFGEQDALITCVASGRGYHVYPPGRVLGIDTIMRSNGKERYLVLFEAPTKAKPVSWTAFSDAAPLALPNAKELEARPLVIDDQREIDAVLRLWNMRGKFRSAGR